MLSFKVTVPPVAEPVTLDQAKAHLRVDFDTDDLLIMGLIGAAREFCEVYSRRAFFEQTIVLSLDAFPLFTYNNGTIPPAQMHGWPYYSAYWDPLCIRLPRPGTVSVESIAYRDLTNTVQTLDPSTYYVDLTSEPARIVPMPSLTWPTTQLYLPGSVQVTYTAGSYGDGVATNNCPRAVMAAMLLMVGHLYEHRETVSELSLKEIPLGIKSLLDTVKFDSFTFAGGY
ncbi:head-tail connector protein [Edaphobacter modestus]|uniref:Putative phiE125 gp8 family phage protein n=1 Tax=Edaphobacter modestus TaxID=388466 RepID=A0A4Q7YR05_9BACT|nr:head-tail connector protein [Edaphobacter modestus]RZU39333.1 putative phiE125 gp8 family phage protein [Edaphobacter modestus]